MIKMRILKLCSILSIFYQSVSSYRILGIFACPSKSHYSIGHNLLKGLANEGHEVTLISAFKEKDQIPNYNGVFLEHSWIESRKSNVPSKYIFTPMTLLIDILVF